MSDEDNQLKDKKSHLDAIRYFQNIGVYQFVIVHLWGRVELQDLH